MASSRQLARQVLSVAQLVVIIRILVAAIPSRVRTQVLSLINRKPGQALSVLCICVAAAREFVWRKRLRLLNLTPPSQPREQPKEQPLDARNNWLVMSTSLRGATEKLFKPIKWSSYNGQEEHGWQGHCTCCKRPIDLRVVEKYRRPWSERAAYVKKDAKGRFAYVITLWGNSAAYVLGAMVLGHSLRRTKTRHDLVCLHTADVPEGFVRLLGKLWDCRKVDHIEVAARNRLTTWDEPNRFDYVFTKLQVMRLVEYEKVLMMDIDLLVMSNVDDIFQLTTPAAMRRGMNESKHQLKHGDWIDGRFFFSGQGGGQGWSQGTGINAGVMLLQPSIDELDQMLGELSELYHPSHCRGNGPEQDYLSRFWADAPWAHISVAYNYQLHQMFYALQPHFVHKTDRGEFLQHPDRIKIAHFSGEGACKPWTRVMKGEFQWPNRKGDADYIRSFAEAFRGYWLWVKRDRTYWDGLKQSVHSWDLNGLELGEDGHVYETTWQDWKGSRAHAKDDEAGAPTASSEDKQPTKTRLEWPDWAFTGTQAVLDTTLTAWFDIFLELEGILGCDVRSELLAAAEEATKQTESDAKEVAAKVEQHKPIASDG